MSQSKGFDKLDKLLQKWIWSKNWTELNDIQEDAIDPILDANQDIIISAPTASGKTEAAFLPAISSVLQNKTIGVGILYISPLKALINDQYRRLVSLQDITGMPVTPWHGDISLSKKDKLINNPYGILLITPESLESLILRKSGWCKSSFRNLGYIIIDEYHAFIGSERGIQLQSLMHRLEFLTQKNVPRIALSATLNDLDSAGCYLRPNAQNQPIIIKPKQGHSGLMVQLRGYIDTAPNIENSYELESIKGNCNFEHGKIYFDLSEERISYKVISSTGELIDDFIPFSDIYSDTWELHDNSQLLSKILAVTDLRGHTNVHDTSALTKIIKDIYSKLRGQSNLIFANSRALTEQISTSLSDLCLEQGVPNEFFPHHGNLSKELRESLETRLQEEKLPTTAVCTMTLELGIDIGIVNSIAQVTSPHSVASLRQRVGRSGRRDDNTSVLRLYLIEDELIPRSHVVDRLRFETFQSIAMVNLLIQGWYEPPFIDQYHMSTLIQQTLSVIGQYGGVLATQLWSLLCKTGPFHKVDQNTYSIILKCMGKNELIQQTKGGQLVLGRKGERLIEHYTFYSAFSVPDEFTLETKGKTLGSIPVDSSLLPNQTLIFAGKRWKIVNIDEQRKIISLVKSTGGTPPKFSGIGQGIHDKVREEMYRIFLAKEMPVYLNKSAKELFQEGIEFFHSLSLGSKSYFQNASTLYLFPWRGDRVVNTIVAILRTYRFEVDNFRGIIEIRKISLEDLKQVLNKLMSSELPKTTDLAKDNKNLAKEKHDIFLSHELLTFNYGVKEFDISGAMNWIRDLKNQLMY